MEGHRDDLERIYSKSSVNLPSLSASPSVANTKRLCVSSNGTETERPSSSSVFHHRGFERHVSNDMINVVDVSPYESANDRFLRTPRSARFQKASSSPRKHRVEPMSDVVDVEQLIEQLRQSKILITQLKEDKLKLQTKVYRLEGELKKSHRVSNMASMNATHEEFEDKIGTKEMKPRPPARTIPENGKVSDTAQTTMKSSSVSSELKLLREAVQDLRKILSTKIFTPREPIEHACRIIESKLHILDTIKADIPKPEKQPDQNEKKMDIRVSPTPSTPKETKESKIQHTPHPPPSLSANTLNIPGVLVDATSTSRAPTMRHSRSTRIGLGQAKPRHSLSLVFSSSSVLMLPRSQLMNSSEGNTGAHESDYYLSREKSALSKIDLEEASWEEFTAWYKTQESTLQQQIVLEMFHVIKGSKKVFDVTSMISFSQTIDEVVDRFKDGAKDVLSADAVHLFVVGPDMKLCPVGSQGAHSPSAYRIGFGVVGKCAETGEILNIRDVSFDEVYDPEYDTIPGLQIRSVLAVPLADRSSHVFAVAAAYKKRDCFGREDEILLQALADQTSNNMQQFKLLMSTIREQKKNQAISEVLKIVNNENGTFDQVIDTIIRVTYDVMPVDRVSFFLVDSIAKQLLLKVSKDNATIRVPIGVGIAGTVAATGNIINIPDAYEDPRFDRSFDIKTGFRTRTILCVPIFDNNKKPVAVIQVLNKATGVFTKDDEELIQTFTAEAASVIQRQSLETAYHNLMASSDSYSADTIKDLLGEYSSTRKIIENATKPKVDLARLSRSAISNLLVQTETYSQMLKDWDLDHFSFPDEEIYNMIIAGFESLDLLNAFKVDPDVMRIFLQVVRSNYRDNPYHNFQHAFSVFQCAYILITSTEVPMYVTPLDMFGLLVATICHDLDHPGTNNAFMMNSQSTLAIIYNDISILENHHSSLTFQITSDQNMNIFANMDQVERTELRKIIIPAILATDMAEHSKLTTNLSVHSNTFSKDKKEDRQFLVNIILHSSDLCNPVLPTKHAYTWASRVLQEFNEQARKERELDMPVAAFMEKTDEISKANLNINFIKYVVSPLWNRMAEIFPSLRVCIERMEANIRSWETVIANGAV